jgi:heme exporter protein B
VFLGKAAAAAVVLFVLEAALAVGVALFYGATWRGVGLLVATCVAATVGLVAPGTIVVTLAAGAGARDTLLPLLFLPAVAPVMIGATRAFEYALAPSAGVPGWRWVGLLAVFAVTYTALGLALFEPLLEDQ